MSDRAQTSGPHLPGVVAVMLFMIATLVNAIWTEAPAFRSAAREIEHCGCGGGVMLLAAAVVALILSAGWTYHRSGGDDVDA